MVQLTLTQKLYFQEGTRLIPTNLKDSPHFSSVPPMGHMTIRKESTPLLSRSTEKRRKRKRECVCERASDRERHEGEKWRKQTMHNPK
jgi:hypothetical protein